ncbi:MAG: ATP-binding protein, partial [Anaerolineales bacterium]|nr:ATP-binding protein [Anaerolineales bacterium]
FGVAFGVAWGVAGGVAGSRFLFYLFEWPLAWFIWRRARQHAAPWHVHPVLWDELAAWPLPATASLLRHSLATDRDEGLCLAAHIAANPFQRGAAQHALSAWLQAHSAPIAALYHLAAYPDLAAYISSPATSVQFRRWPAARTVLLSEIGQQFIAATSDSGESSERLVWRLTKRQRYMQPTSFAHFSLLLRDLYEAQTDLQTSALSPIHEELLAHDRYQELRPLPGGAEIVHTFDLIRTYLGCTAIGDLAAMPEELAALDNLDMPLIRPAVVQALHALGDISAQVALFQEATSLSRQTTALNLAAGRLAELESYVREQVQPPERVLFIRIVGLWQDIVAQAQGALGQQALRGMNRAEQRAVQVTQARATIWERPAAPIANPYIVGDPVYPPLLAGRTDIFNRIAEVWSAKANPDSIILYGHRRMGKSSILRNLEQAAPPGSLVVYADLAGETSFVASSGDLLLALADKLYLGLHSTLHGAPHDAADLPEPDPAQYANAAQAQFHFNRLTGRIAALLAGRTLIFALDEFEALEQAVAAGKIGVEIYQFLRTKSQEPWLTLVFGGLHTLDEMSRDYQQPFYGSYANIRVSYLTHADAWRLITNPAPDFTLNYDHDAVERIIAETGGQPYLVQQVCR